MRLVQWGAIVALMAGSLGATVRTQREPITYDDEMKLVSFEDLAYPPVAQDARIEGVVVVSADLDDNGNVVEAKPLSGPRELVVAAAANAKQWRFVPNARKNAVIVYEFRIEGACNKARPTLFRVWSPNFAQITACGSQLQVELRSLQPQHSSGF